MPSTNVVVWPQNVPLAVPLRSTIFCSTARLASTYGTTISDLEEDAIAYNVGAAYVNNLMARRPIDPNGKLCTVSTAFSKIKEESISSCEMA